MYADSDYFIAADSSQNSLDAVDTMRLYVVETDDGEINKYFDIITILLPIDMVSWKKRNLHCVERVSREKKVRWSFSLPILPPELKLSKRIRQGMAIFKISQLSRANKFSIRKVGNFPKSWLNDIRRANLQKKKPIISPCNFNSGDFYV